MQDSSLNQINVRYSGPLRGELFPPPDKSISHRAIMLSSLAEGNSKVSNILRAEDPLRTLEAFRQMGIEIEFRVQSPVLGDRTNEIVIKGKGLNGLTAPKDIIDCGNSGTTMRLLSGVLAGQSFFSELTGDESLRKRPMQRIITPLSKMGARIDSENGYPPLRIKGGVLKPIHFESPVASAQVKSAILLAGLYCDGTTTVIEPGKSRDHTERMLTARGADITIRGLEVNLKGGAGLKPLDFTVPGDLSSAAFFIVACLLVPESEIIIKNTGVNPTRTGIIEILQEMGAHVVLENTHVISGEPVADIHVKYSELSGIDIGAEMVLKAIDEFPILCVAAAKAHGTSRMQNARELRVKESDRIASMASELKKMGSIIEEFEDGLIIEGQEHLKPAKIESKGDHRIAMSMAVAGLTVEGETTISDAECVNTSFPGFMDMMGSLFQK